MAICVSHVIGLNQIKIVDSDDPLIHWARPIGSENDLGVTQISKISNNPLFGHYVAMYLFLHACLSSKEFI